MEAIVLHDVELLTLVAPIFDQPDLQRALLERYPLMFWLGLPALIGHGLEEGEIAWLEVGGQWLLMSAH